MHFWDAPSFPGMGGSYAPAVQAIALGQSFRAVWDVGNWDAGGIEAPIAKLTLSNENPEPSPCFAMLRMTAKGIVYEKSLTRPTQSIWNCNPKNVVQLTAAQQAEINAL